MLSHGVCICLTIEKTFTRWREKEVGESKNYLENEKNDDVEKKRDSSSPQFVINEDKYLSAVNNGSSNYNVYFVGIINVMVRRPFFSKPKLNCLFAVVNELLHRNNPTRWRFYVTLFLTIWAIWVLHVALD